MSGTPEDTDRSQALQSVRCTLDRHGAAILAMLNQVIRTSTALYDYRERTSDSMVTWFQTKADGGFPVIGLEDAVGTLVGFATYGTFRTFPAYKYTVEHSVYVRQDQQGKGLGRTLLARLIDHARQDDRHVLVGAIDATNTASIALHLRLGFLHAGTVRQAGFKFGRWLDLALYQLILDAPTTPTDG